MSWKLVFSCQYMHKPRVSYRYVWVLYEIAFCGYRENVNDKEGNKESKLCSSFFRKKNGVCVLTLRFGIQLHQQDRFNVPYKKGEAEISVSALC